MDYIPIEIWQQVLFQSTFLDQIRLRQVCVIFHNRLEIHDFYNIDRKYLHRLNDSILSNYSFIRSLNSHNNLKITNINYMTQLVELDASGGYCGITDQGISQLNLIKLNVSYNQKITNINHMTKLVELTACGRNCGINNVDLCMANPLKLDVSYNHKITNI